jgi:hypothetical protein
VNFGQRPRSCQDETEAPRVLWLCLKLQ